MGATTHGPVSLLTCPMTIAHKAQQSQAAKTYAESLETLMGLEKKLKTVLKGLDENIGTEGKKNQKEACTGGE